MCIRDRRENLLGEEGSALKRMLVGLDGARVNIAMGAVGAARAALELSIDYARTRTQFGKPIGSFQLVQKLIVDMTVRVEAARALALRAAAALDANADDARIACSIAKLYATEAAHAVIDYAFGELAAEAVEIRCRVINNASRRVIHKLSLIHI